MRTDFNVLFGVSLSFTPPSPTLITLKKEDECGQNMRRMSKQNINITKFTISIRYYFI